MENYLTITINFISSRDAEEDRVMYAKSNNVGVTSYDNVNYVVDKLFKALLSRYQHK